MAEAHGGIAAELLFELAVLATGQKQQGQEPKDQVF
jgi:hypothetical protein